jgi:hypothetical protein
MKVKDVIDFIVEHKGKTTFIALTLPQIAWMVSEAIKNKSIWIMVNKDSISGLIIANINHEEKKIFVTENLAITIKNLKEFARRARLEFPGYTIEAVRHNCRRKFNTQKLYSKLT